MRGKKLRRILQGCFVSVVLTFWAIYLWQNWTQLGTHRWELHPLPLALGVGIAVSAYLAYALTWHRTLAVLGGKLSMRSAVRLWMQSLVMRYIPGSLWHIAGRAYLGRSAGESASLVLVASILEQFFTLTAGVLVALLAAGLFALTNPLGWLSLVALALSLAAVHPSTVRLAARLVTKLERQLGPGEDGELPTTESIMPLALERLRFRDVLELQAIYVGVMLFTGMTFYSSLWAVGAGTSVALPLALGIFAASWTIGFLSLFAPSGLGAREAAVALLLTPTIGAPAALATSIVSRILLSLGEALLLAYAQFILQPKAIALTTKNSQEP